jgi:DNA polymerase III delta' subunit
MNGAHIRGQPAALAAAATMLRGGFPHAVLLVGPASIGKTTLALDIAAALLCVDPDPAARPCRSCRGCRLVDGGRHPDLHRLGPGGAADQVKLEATQADPRPGVRDLVAELALSSVEGGARVAVVERAHRMNEDAQNALLKTLEEPASGVHLILCADDEDRLLPTIRSRCARIRLGTVAPRAIEAWLTERGVADPPAAARLARLAEGRPGVALAYAESPAAIAARSEVDRTLLDLLSARVAERLAARKQLLGGAGTLTAALSGTAVEVPVAVVVAAASDEDGERASGTSADDPDTEEGRPVKTPAAVRRRAALALIEVWRELTVDLVRAGGGDVRRVHDAALLEEISTAAGSLATGPTVSFLARLDRAARAVELSASPELAVDALLVAWPHLAAA